MNSITLLLVGIGGALGSVSRFLVGHCCSPMSARFGMPVGTFIVNLVGCFLIGMIGALAIRHDGNAFFGQIKTLAIPGFLGGFTTYSAYAYESFELFSRGEWASALLYILLTSVLGFSAVAVGFCLSNYVFSVS